MKRLFAALRFVEDGNIADRVYWYLAEAPLKEGEFVFAPVGLNNRLQRARVEKLLSAEEENAPYDVRLLKRVAARCDGRKLTMDGICCYEFGGARYDEKRYTAFGRVLVSEEIPQALAELRTYGVTETLAPAECGAAETVRGILRARGCVLVCGGGAAQTAKTLIAFLRGEGSEIAEFLSAEECRLLKEKLTKSAN